MATKEIPQTSWRTCSMYTFGEAARLADISPMTVRHWVLGSPNQRGKPRPPLLSAKKEHGPFVSFLQLIEITVAARLRKAEGASFKAVRKAYLNAQEQFGYEYPFAHVKLEAIGRHIVHLMRGDESVDSFQAMDEPQQRTLPGLLAVAKISAELDYEDDLAARWWPEGKNSVIVIDPQISAGRPTIAGRGVTADAIYARLHKAKEPIDFVMQDFRLNREQVNAAIEYCERLAA